MNNKSSPDTDLEEMREKFMALIKEHSQPWWSEKVGVSQAVVSSSWTAGKLPRVETLLKILKLKEVSPTWIFFGIGPKYLTDLDHQDASVTRNREIHLKMQMAESELIELRQKVRNLELLLKQQQLCLRVPLLKDAEAASEKASAVPVLTLMRMLNDVLYKSFELAVNEDNAESIIDWIKENFDSNQYTTIAALKEVEKIIS